jgi:hypothetical protein
MLRPLSLTTRLVVMVSALLALSILTVLAFAYYEMRVAGELAETARIQQGVTRIAAIFEAANAQRLTQLRRPRRRSGRRLRLAPHSEASTRSCGRGRPTH